jgi:hypothetical protein
MPEDHDAPRIPAAAAANVARIYDYLVGGKDNYGVDRVAAEALLQIVPEAAIAAKQNRAFLGRAVQFLARDAGIRQFIDIGTGLPTRGNVHEIAQRSVPDARVLYVDNDPVVAVHAQALLADNATTVAINRDLREPDGILGHPALRALIDLREPVAVLLVAVLHFIRDAENPYAIVDRLKEAMAPGSYLVISHVTGDYISSEATATVRKLYDRANAPGVARSHAEVTRFFSELEVIPPGLVSVSSWRARPQRTKSGRVIFYAGIGRKGRRR